MVALIADAPQAEAPMSIEDVPMAKKELIAKEPTPIEAAPSGVSPRPSKQKRVALNEEAPHANEKEALRGGIPWE